VRLHPVGELLEPHGPAGRGRLLPGDEPQQPRHPLVAEVLRVGRARVQRPVHVVEARRRPHAHPGIEASAGQYVHRGQILGEPQRVLPAERYHRGAELDPRGVLRGGRQHGDWGGDAVLQVPVPHPCAVESEPLAERDRLQRSPMPGTWIIAVEQADGQESELLKGNPRLRHALSLSKSTA